MVKFGILLQLLKRKCTDSKDYIIRNATVWTQYLKRNCKNYDVKISKGKIVEVGTQLNKGNAEEIDGTNLHLTNGIIDEHTHIGLSRGVNEAGSNSSAEVRMSDVINPDDVISTDKL